MGRLAELHDEYQGTGVQFLGMCTDVYAPGGQTAQDANALLNSTGVDYTNVCMTMELLQGVTYQPSTVIYDSAGNVIGKHTGSASKQDWINMIESLMA